MSFGGIRAIILILVFIGGFWAMRTFGLPTWSPIVILMVTAVVLNSVKVKKKE